MIGGPTIDGGGDGGTTPAVSCTRRKSTTAWTETESIAAGIRFDGGAVRGIDSTSCVSMKPSTTSVPQPATPWRALLVYVITR
jgi:hypothetical protein